jgi:hypothetical protein
VLYSHIGMETLMNTFSVYHGGNTIITVTHRDFTEIILCSFYKITVNHSLQEKRNIEAVKLQRLINNCHRSIYYRRFLRRFKQPLLAFYFFLLFDGQLFPSKNKFVVHLVKTNYHVSLFLSRAAPIAIRRFSLHSANCSLST